MELSLVDITPAPDDERKPADGALALEFPAVEVVATPPAEAKPAPSTSEPPSGLQLVDRVPSVEAATTPAPSQEIELVAVGTRRAPVARPADLAPPPTDSFAAEAMREYKDGNIDLPLWSRAMAQHAGDQPAVVVAYLRARATVLKLERRQRRVDDPNPPVRAAIPARISTALRDDDDAMTAVSPLRLRAVRRYAVMAVPVVVALVAGVWWMVSSSDRDSVQASYPVVAPAVAGSTVAVAVAPHAPRVTNEEDPGTYFAGKILDLKSAGNWNVLVLFASEWTRKQPSNATAWRELSIGYTNMRQFADALEAGTKAAQLAPADPRVWRNLAQVNLDLKEPEAALKAFERAAALNDLDVIILLQVGTLNVEINRLPQARAAFDRVLAADPDNQEALCGSASVAQRQGRGKDADSASRQLRTADRKCRELPGTAAPAVAVAVATRK